MVGAKVPEKHAVGIPDHHQIKSTICFVITIIIIIATITIIVIVIIIIIVYCCGGMARLDDGHLNINPMKSRSMYDNFV